MFTWFSCLQNTFKLLILKKIIERYIICTGNFMKCFIIRIPENLMHKYINCISIIVPESNELDLKSWENFKVVLFNSKAKNYYLTVSSRQLNFEVWQFCIQILQDQPNNFFFFFGSNNFFLIVKFKRNISIHIIFSVLNAI